MDNIRILERDLNRPYICEKCGEKLEYKGIGEYRCPKCLALAYDDYGKVRQYLEHHHGATLDEVSKATGVSKNAIRQLLRDDKIEVTENSAVFLYCEVCEMPIRSGRLCDKCLMKRNAAIESNSRRQTTNNISGYGKGTLDTSGAKRFQR